MSQVATEIRLKSGQSPQSSPTRKGTKKSKNKDNEHLLRCRQELEELEAEYEERIKSIHLHHDEEVEKLNRENHLLIEQNKELLQAEEKSSKENGSLKHQLNEIMRTLQNDGKAEAEAMDKIREELSKMKTCHDIEVSALRENKMILEEVSKHFNNFIKNVCPHYNHRI